MLNKKSIVTAVIGTAAAIGVVACGNGNTPPPVLAPVTVSLIGLNDFHGNIQPPGGGVVVADPANAAGTRVSAGGAAYLATLIANLKRQNPGNTLVVAAGDMVGASPLASGLFHDEPTIDALGQMGLDISSVGNHEFDKGRDELLRLQRGGCFPLSTDGKTGQVGIDTCMNNGAFAGAKFQYLAANVIDQRTGATLFPPYVVKSVAGVKVGFIGLTLKDTPTVVTPAGVAGLQFTDEVATVNALVPLLKAQDVSAIVVLIHQGGAATASVVNDKSCPGFSGDITALADKFDPAVDVIVSGHTHQEYVCSRPDGKLVTQTGSYGRIATKIDLTIDPNVRKVMKKSADNLVAMNDLGIKDATGALIAPPSGMAPLAKQAGIDALVARYVGLVAPITGKVIGKVAGVLDRKQNRSGESTLGEVIADSFLLATSTAEYGSKPAQIAFTNPGGIRADLATTLEITFGQLYNVMPFGNNLVTMDLTGAQLLRLLEQQWEAPQPAGGRIMPVSAGFTYSWDASQPEGAAPGTGNRVVASTMKLNGIAIDPLKAYRVSANSFIASGGDRYTVFASGTNRQQGGVDLDAAVAYLKSLITVPVPPMNRITRIN